MERKPSPINKSKLKYFPLHTPCFIAISKLYVIKKDYHSHLKILSLPSVITILCLCKEIVHKLHQPWKKRQSCSSYPFLGPKKKKKNLKAYLPLRYYLQENATVLQFGFLYEANINQNTHLSPEQLKANLEEQACCLAYLDVGVED